MRLELMHQNVYSYATIAKVFTGLFLLLAPSEFWNQVVMLLEVPEIVKVAIAPFGGSLILVLGEWVVEEAKRIELERGMIQQGKIEALNELRKNEKLMRNTASYFLAKVLVGWIAGAFCYSLLAKFVNGPSWTVAFVGGLVGHWGVTVYLKEKQKKFIDNDTNPPKP